VDREEGARADQAGDDRPCFLFTERNPCFIFTEPVSLPVVRAVPPRDPQTTVCWPSSHVGRFAGVVAIDDARAPSLAVPLSLLVLTVCMPSVLCRHHGHVAGVLHVHAPKEPRPCLLGRGS
jgi:hypothetical protein